MGGDDDDDSSFRFLCCYYLTMPRPKRQSNKRITLACLALVLNNISLTASLHVPRIRGNRSILRHPLLAAQSPQHEGDDDEIFSVAPMMGHTNRHYRYFWRLFSKHSTLYTEMIPASTIVQAYDMQAKQVTHNLDVCDLYHPKCIQQVLQKIQQDQANGSAIFDNMLDDLLRDDTRNGKITLQLGGRDRYTLAAAAGIATAYQNLDGRPAYSGINLNCGCPSTSVASGRRTGAALMLEPHHVVECLNAMTQAIHDVCDDSSRSVPTLSVKHRLGVQDADAYQWRKQELIETGQYSLEQEEQEAYQSCHDFVSQLVSSPDSNHDTSRIQVHARLALLGLDINVDKNKVAEKPEPSSAPNLWVPESGSSNPEAGTVKVNHQRAQYRAKQQARQATIDNRRIPPLHHNIVPEIAREFSDLEVITNGGIDSLPDVQERVIGGIHGAMVGRATINHPCAFAGVDAALFQSENATNDLCSSRRAVLDTYSRYCVEQEEEFRQKKQQENSNHARNEGLCALRKALVAPAFHLMVGEDGNAEYQRLLKKLVGRSQRHSSAQMLQAAMAQVPSTTLYKAIQDHVPWYLVQEEFVEKHGEAAAGATKRSGSMQRVIH